MYQLILKKSGKGIFSIFIYIPQLPNMIKEMQIYFEYFTLIQQLLCGNLLRNLKNEPECHIQTLRVL